MTVSALKTSKSRIGVRLYRKRRSASAQRPNPSDLSELQVDAGLGQSRAVFRFGTRGS